MGVALPGKRFDAGGALPGRRAWAMKDGFPFVVRDSAGRREGICEGIRKMPSRENGSTARVAGQM
jgi:hypothetical protein